jgi:hypothetical protein
MTHKRMTYEEQIEAAIEVLKPKLITDIDYVEARDAIIDALNIIDMECNNVGWQQEVDSQKGQLAIAAFVKVLKSAELALRELPEIVQFISFRELDLKQLAKKAEGWLHDYRPDPLELQQRQEHARVIAEFVRRCRPWVGGTVSPGTKLRAKAASDGRPLELRQRLAATQARNLLERYGLPVMTTRNPRKPLSLWNRLSSILFGDLKHNLTRHMREIRNQEK